MKKISLNEQHFRQLIENIIDEALNEAHLPIVDNIEDVIKWVGEHWTSPDDVWWIKIEARLKDYMNYNRRNPNANHKRWWKFQNKVDSTHRENHVGYVIVRGHSSEACQNSIRNAVVHLNPWAAKQFGSDTVYSNGNAEAIKMVCNRFFARSYITINNRLMSNTVDRAKMDKQNTKYNPFKGREFHHRIGQTRTGTDTSGINWNIIRPYGLVDCDVDNAQAQQELEKYFADNNVDILLKKPSHDGMHYIITIEQAKNLDFGFMDKYSTNNRKGDPNVLFKPDANIIVYSPVG